MMERPEFSVYQFFRTGDYCERVRDHVMLSEAVEAARHYTDNVATKMDIIEKVVITDGLDRVVFEWKPHVGVTWPEEARGRR
jgi:hypothetical protein